MDDQHADATAVRRALPRAVGALAAVGFIGASTLLLGAGATANAAPKPNYQSGKDTATFAVTGILDKNCLVSVGGNKVYIKPGDAIDFKSTLAGVDVSGLLGSLGGGVLGGLGNTLTGSSVAGLNVNATLDAKSSHPQKFSVTGGHTTTIKNLSKGTHTLNWTATSLQLLPGLTSTGKVPLSSSQLQSGAKLSWSGNVYVTTGAPDCRLAISTPNAKISAGPVHIGIPGVNVAAPVDPKKIVQNLNPKKGTTAKSNTQKPATTNSGSGGALSGGTDGLLPVPSRVVPGGYGSTSAGGAGGGGFYGSTDTGSSGTGYASLQLSNPDGSKTTLGGSSNSDSSQPAANADSATSKSSPAAQLPVVLAIVAIIALALVASTYARLFLLRRNT